MKVLVYPQHEKGVKYLGETLEDIEHFRGVLLSRRAFDKEPDPRFIGTFVLAHVAVVVLRTRHCYVGAARYNPDDASRGEPYSRHEGFSRSVGRALRAAVRGKKRLSLSGADFRVASALEGVALRNAVLERIVQLLDFAPAARLATASTYRELERGPVKARVAATSV